MFQKRWRWVDHKENVQVDPPQGKLALGQNALASSLPILCHSVHITSPRRVLEASDAEV